MVEGAPTSKKAKVAITVTTEFLVDIPNTEITEYLDRIRKIVLSKNIEIVGSDSKIEQSTIKDLGVRMTY